MLELGKIAFTEVARLAKSGKSLTILPVGVVEEHGAHLPLGLDSFAAEVYAASAAPHLEEAGYEVVVAPTINYGVARAAYEEAIRRRPGRIITLRQKTRVLAESRRKT